MAPARREFRVISLPCEVDTATVAHDHGSLVEQTRLVGDTTLLAIREWRWTDRPRVSDTTSYERSTLAPLWNHAHSQSWSASWEVHGPHAAFVSQQPGGARESVDSTIEEPAFLAGSTHLLISVTPRLYAPGVLVRFSLLDLVQEPGERPSFAVHRANARVTGSETVTVSARRIEAWVVTVDEPPGGRTYWIDKDSHEVLMWRVPGYESVCPEKYVRSWP